MVEASPNERAAQDIRYYRDREAAWTGAFVAAQAELQNPSKNKQVTVRTKDKGSYSYNYAELSDIINQVRPILKKHGLAFLQSVVPAENGIGIETTLVHEAGHRQTYGPLILPANGDAQARGSAITYGRRYALCALLGIAAEEDDDAGSVVGAGSVPAARPAPTKSSSTPSPSEEATETGAARAVDEAIKALAARLEWSPSKVLSFARKTVGIKASSADTKKWSEEDATIVEAALMNEVGGE
jgi:hypothetical protein